MAYLGFRRIGRTSVCLCLSLKRNLGEPRGRTTARTRLARSTVSRPRPATIDAPPMPPFQLFAAFNAATCEVTEVGPPRRMRRRNSLISPQGFGVAAAEGASSCKAAPASGQRVDAARQQETPTCPRDALRELRGSSTKPAPALSRRVHPYRTRHHAKAECSTAAERDAGGKRPSGGEQRRGSGLATSCSTTR